MLRLTFRPATAEDTDLLVSLVNSAYRGDVSRAGWTTEADLLGGQRTDSDEIQSLITTQNSIILLGMQDTEVIASLHLRLDGTNAQLGMFAIKPTLQGAGIGKQCLQKAEHFVQHEWGVSTIAMTVITLRHELIAYYERRGYRNTGLLKPFPASPKFGIPRVTGLQLTVLIKSLST